jgi:hypothetical protein
VAHQRRGRLTTPPTSHGCCRTRSLEAGVEIQVQPGHQPPEDHQTANLNASQTGLVREPLKRQLLAAEDQAQADLQPHRPGAKAG